LTHYWISALSILGRFTTTDCVNTIAGLDGKIYVFCHEVKILLFVYDEKTFVRLDDVALPEGIFGRSTASQLAACSSNHVLYISDIGNRCILQMTVDTYKVVKWLDILAQVILYQTKQNKSEFC